MGLVLYRAVGAHKRVALGGLVGADTEYFTAEKNDDGVITLTPVNIVGATATDVLNGADSGQEEPRDTSPGY